MTVLTHATSPRWEAIPKVRGQTRYTADEPAEGMLHAAIVGAPAACGRVLAFDRQAVLGLPGVLAVYGIGDLPALRPAGFSNWLADDAVHFAGQAVALVVALDQRSARDAARLAAARVQMAVEPAVACLAQATTKPHAPATAGRVATDTQRGDPDAAWAAAHHRLALEFHTAGCQHHVLEPHASLATWNGDQLTLFTSTQAVFATRRTVAHSLGLPPDQVRVVTRQLGGGLGSKGPLWWPLSLRVVQIARLLGRPVQLELTRPQMATQVGRRSPTQQRLWLGADADGRLASLVHDTLAETAPTADYADPVGAATRWLYACDHVRTSHRLQQVHAPQPIPMRAPGESPGLFALETAMDELAWVCRIDPVELRRRNLAADDPHHRRPWSSNSLVACWQQVSDSFGWARRPPEPGGWTDGDWQVGWGMANAAYPLNATMATTAEVGWLADGSAVVRCGVQDMGSGTFNMLADTVAQVLGLPAARVDVQLGDSLLPEGPYSAGAMVTASVVPAVQAAAQAVEARRAAGEALPIVAQGRHVPAAEPSHSTCTFGAVMAEVRVHRASREIRVSRLHAAYAAGRIVSPRLARSQCVGGLVGGLGMALMEASIIDPVTAQPVNDQLVDYLLPVCADMPELQVHLVNECDPHLPGGAKGVGMVGATGTAAAIANALWHATGQRLRSLPLRLDQLLLPVSRPGGA